MKIQTELLIQTHKNDRLASAGGAGFVRAGGRERRRREWRGGERGGRLRGRLGERVVELLADARHAGAPAAHALRDLCPLRVPELALQQRTLHRHRARHVVDAADERALAHTCEIPRCSSSCTEWSSGQQEELYWEWTHIRQETAPLTRERSAARARCRQTQRVATRASPQAASESKGAASAAVPRDQCLHNMNIQGIIP